MKFGIHLLVVLAAGVLLHSAAQAQYVFLEQDPGRILRTETTLVPAPQRPQPSPLPPHPFATSSQFASESAGQQWQGVPNVVQSGADPYESAPLSAGDYWSDKPRCWQRMHTWAEHLWQDVKNFYATPETWLWIGGGVALAAPIANTTLDDQFGDWYQRRYTSNKSVNDTVLKIKELGNHGYMIPATMAVAFGCMWLEDKVEWATPVEEWAGRTLRGWAIGSPTVGLLQLTLGGHRPSDGVDSHWTPFSEMHGASGHAFVGAVPFLTAAEMVENPFAKTALFAASFVVGWTRIHTDSHYISQVGLGWLVAFRAVTSVARTNRGESSFDIFPSREGNTSLVNVMYRY